MEPIGPGDFVECVDARGAPELTLGSIYMVRLICDDGGGCWLREVDPPPFHDGFFISRFRPIYRPKASLIQSLLHPAKEPIRQEILDWVTRHG